MSSSSAQDPGEQKDMKTPPMEETKTKVGERSMQHGLLELKQGDSVDYRSPEGWWTTGCVNRVLSDQNHVVVTSDDGGEMICVDWNHDSCLAPYRRFSSTAAAKVTPPPPLHLGNPKQPWEALVGSVKGTPRWRNACIVEEKGWQVLVEYSAEDDETDDEKKNRFYWVDRRLNELHEKPTHNMNYPQSLDTDLVTDLLDYDLVCCSCSCIPIHPVSPAHFITPAAAVAVVGGETDFCCGTVMCSPCLETWHKKKNNCPHCLQPSQLGAASALAMKKISGLSIYCPNKLAGCKFTCLVGLRGSTLFRHLDTCAFRLVKCEDCHESVRNRDFPKHWKGECPKRPIECVFCRDVLSAVDMPRHHSVDGMPGLHCAGLTYCPNSCTAKPILPKWQLPDHLLECPNADTKCAACGLVMQNKLLAEHLKADPVGHYKILVSTLEGARKVLRRWERWSRTIGLSQQSRPDSIAKSKEESPRSPNPLRWK